MQHLVRHVLEEEEKQVAAGTEGLECGAEGGVWQTVGCGRGWGVAKGGVWQRVGCGLADDRAWD